MNILDKIVAYKQKEITMRRVSHPIKLLEQSIYFDRQVLSLKAQLMDKEKSGIIAEFKRRSPSKGPINGNVSIKETSRGYIHGGACALSVLTDNEFFSGSREDLVLARQNNNVPILRKDFIIDEYQLWETRAMGADVVLLIATILHPKKLARLAACASGLGLEVLMEVHNKEELKSLNSHIDIIGVNNRNLRTFLTDTNLSLSLLPFIPSGFAKISESGISKPAIAVQLKKAGFDGFLIGEQFMKHRYPEQACADFISNFKKQVYAN